MDRVYLAITNFVTGRMSEKYVTPPVISFEAIFEQSNPFSPIIFILSPGSDPASDLMKLAERSGFGGNKLKFLAMGQGQEKVTPLICLHLLLFFLIFSSLRGTQAEMRRTKYIYSLLSQTPFPPFPTWHATPADSILVLCDSCKR